MKKLIKLSALLVTLMAVFASCKKSTEKILPKNDGKWKFLATEIYKVDDVTDDTFTYGGTIEFTESMFVLTSDGSSATGTWSANDETIVLTVDGDSLPFKIVKSRKNSQHWEFRETEVDDRTGTVYEYILTWDLER